MRKVIYAMTASLDGYVSDLNGGIDWSAPDEELFRFHTERVENTDLQICGRRLYETMLYWETVPQDTLTADHKKFAVLWKALPKLVFSKTLDKVEGNASLCHGDLASELQRLKKLPGSDIAVGGAVLAHACMRLGLIDEWHLFVAPVVLGGGQSYFPQGISRTDLQLLETKTFNSSIAYSRYGQG